MCVGIYEYSQLTRNSRYVPNSSNITILFFAGVEKTIRINGLQVAILIYYFVHSYDIIS